MGAGRSAGYVEIRPAVGLTRRSRTDFDEAYGDEDIAAVSPMTACKPRSPRAPPEPRSVMIPPKIDLNKEPPSRLQKSDSLPALNATWRGMSSTEGGLRGPRGFFSKASPGKREAARHK